MVPLNKLMVIRESYFTEEWFWLCFRKTNEVTQYHASYLLPLYVSVIFRSKGGGEGEEIRRVGEGKVGKFIKKQ